MELIQINATDPYGYIRVDKSEMYGGILFTIGLSQDALLLLDYVKLLKINQERDQQTRENNPFVKGLYEQYLVGLELARKDANI